MSYDSFINERLIYERLIFYERAAFYAEQPVAPPMTMTGGRPL